MELLYHPAGWHLSERTDSLPTGSSRGASQTALPTRTIGQEETLKWLRPSDLALGPLTYRLLLLIGAAPLSILVGHAIFCELHSWDSNYLGPKDEGAIKGTNGRWKNWCAVNSTTPGKLCKFDLILSLKTVFKHETQQITEIRTIGVGRKACEIKLKFFI